MSPEPLPPDTEALHRSCRPCHYDCRVASSETSTFLWWLLGGTSETVVTVQMQPFGLIEHCRAGCIFVEQHSSVTQNF